MAAADAVLEIDATSLKALAHPIRTRILRILEVRRQVSVTSLAAELGESTGTTSYHLRQLARHGFVEQFTPDDAAPPTGRSRAGRPQRWWRMAVDQVHFSGFDYLARSDTRAAAEFVLRDVQADRTRRLTEWYANATQWPAAWQRASSDSDRRLELDPGRKRGRSPTS